MSLLDRMNDHLLVTMHLGLTAAATGQRAHMHHKASLKAIGEGDLIDLRNTLAALEAFAAPDISAIEQQEQTIRICEKVLEETKARLAAMEE